jgi:hypothetical protein
LFAPARGDAIDPRAAQPEAREFLGRGVENAPPRALGIPHLGINHPVKTL